MLHTSPNTRAQTQGEEHLHIRVQQVAVRRPLVGARVLLHVEGHRAVLELDVVGGPVGASLGLNLADEPVLGWGW